MIPQCNEAVNVSQYNMRYDIKMTEKEKMEAE